MGVRAPIFIDSCIAIYAVEAAAKQGPAVTRLMNEVRDTSQFCFSDLVRLECRVKPLRTGAASVLAEYERYFGMLTCLAITSEVFELATELRAQHGLRIANAIHVATALNHNCKELWTNDDRMAKASSRITFRRVP